MATMTRVLVAMVAVAALCGVAIAADVAQPDIEWKCDICQDYLQAGYLAGCDAGRFVSDICGPYKAECKAAFDILCGMCKREDCDSGCEHKYACSRLGMCPAPGPCGASASTDAVPATEHARTVQMHQWHGPESAVNSSAASPAWLPKYSDNNSHNLGRGCDGCNITRAEVIARAMKWVDEKVPYCQCGGRDCCGTCKYCHMGSPPYRCDCSGFVSHSWRLPGGLVTQTLGEVSHEIEKEQLKPGDALLNPAEHVMLFNGWANHDHSAFHAIQEAGCNAAPLPPHAVANIQSWPVWGVPHLFKPMRYNHIIDH